MRLVAVTSGARLLVAGALIVATGSVCCCCASVLGVDEVAYLAGDAAVAPADAVLPPADAGEAGSRCPDGYADAAVMVRVGASCIDPYEVTQTDYGVFLAAKAGATTGQPPECQANTTYAPRYGFPAIPTTLPITWVDWCDALAYCTWAGKRLCGAVDGGPLPVDHAATFDDEWYLACSHSQDGLHEYPYGNAYEGSACNGAGVPNGYLTPVGSSKKCEGGYAGLFDMSGNAREWIASCAPTADGGRACSNRGGAYYEGDTPALLCRYAPMALADDENIGIGFRCCATAR